MIDIKQIILSEGSDMGGVKPKSKVPTLKKRR
jgi:hypothetical protein